MSRLKKILQTLSKCVTYPTMGSLTENLSFKFRDLVGKNWYNPQKAHDVSGLTNIITNTVIFYFGVQALGMNHSLATTMSCMMPLMSYPVEIGIRGYVEDYTGKFAPSLAGKLVSIPLETILRYKIVKRCGNKQTFGVTCGM